MSKFFGTVTREIEGEEYRFVLDFNAICHFETATGENFFSVASKWEEPGSEPSGTHLRALLHAAMMENHPETTAAQAGRLASMDTGIFEQLMSAVRDGLDTDGGKPGKKKKAEA